ncbi:MAG TPA: hypothetical protein VK809_06215 [Bacteroidia bacterium]|jgi:hypothetical protein|nr:hypothetical protein [Bacteroidia bacterium]
MNNKKWFYAAFIVINLLLSCYYLDVWITPNTACRAMPVLALYEDKTIVIDKYKDYAGDVSVINNHTYSNKAPLSSFLVYPFYSLYKSMGLPELKDTTLKKYPIYIWAYKNPDGSLIMADGRSFLLPKSSTVFILGDILCGVIPFIIALFLSLFAIKRITSKVSPVAIVMLSFYASFLFTYAGAYTGHLLSGIFALAGYVFLKKKNYLLAGLLLGLGVATEFTVGILVPVWALLIFTNENEKKSLWEKFVKLVFFGGGLIPGMVIVLYYNYHLTGSVFKTPYNYEVHQQKQNAQELGFNAPTLQAFWGIVFSTYRGLLFYAPIFILLLWYVLKNGYQNFFKNAKSKMALLSAGLKNYLLLTVVAFLLLISAYYQWPGGWAFGPRYLIPMVLIALYEGVIYLSSKRISPYVFYGLTGLGLLFVWMDKSTKLFMLPDFPQDYEKMNLNAGLLHIISDYKNPVFNIVVPDFMQHKFNANMLPVFIFDSSPAAAIYLWPVLFVAGLILLARWYDKLFPAPVEIPVAKPKAAPKKLKRK